MQKGGELIALTIPFLLYLFFRFWSAPESLNIQVERDLSADRTTPNSDVVVTVKIINHGADIEELLLDEEISPRLTPRLGSPRHLIWLAKGSSHTFTYIVAGPRGMYVFDSVNVTATESLGLIRRLERAGIQVIEWDVSIPLDQAIGPALTRPRRLL